MALRAASPSMIGREAEMDRLLRALDASAAATVVVLLSGEAGVGKTRLVHELGARARDAGVQTHTGRCVDLGGTVWPLAPLREILSGLVDDLDPDALDLVLGGARRALARVAPDLGGAPPDDHPLAMDELCDLVHGVVRRLARRSPVVLAFEDLHWADPSTLAVFSTLARAGRMPGVLLLGTFRSDELHRRHPLLPTLAELHRSAPTDRIEVPPLDRVATHALVESLIGQAVDRAFVVDVHDRAGGNPYHIEELVAAHAAGSGGIPASLRDAVLSRTAAFDEDATAVLDIVAVAGRASPDVIADVAGLPASRVKNALASLGEHALLVRDGEDARFRHELGREVIVDDLVAGDRTQLHIGLAEAISRLRPDELGAVARHWFAAFDGEHALPASVAAARQAMLTGAAAEAAAHFAQALEVWETVDDPAGLAGVDHPGLLAEASSAAHHARDEDRAIELAERAVDELAGTDPEREAKVWLQIGDLHHFMSRFERAAHAGQHAVPLLRTSAPGSPLLAIALARAATDAELAGRVPEAVALAQEAIAIAEAAGDATAVIEGYYALMWITASCGDLAAAVDLARQNVARCTPETFPELVVQALNGLTNMLFRLGRYEELIPIAARGVEIARRTGLAGPRGSWMAIYWLECLVVLGLWEEAERVVAELAVELDHPSIAGEWEGTWGLVLTRQGRLDEARPLMERAQTRLVAGSVEHPAWLLACIVEFTAIDHTLDALAPLLDERVAAPLGDPTAEADAVGAVFVAIGWPGAGADGAVARSAACWHERAKAVRATVDVSDPDSPLLLDAADAQWDRLQGRSDPERWATIADGWSRRGRPFDEALARFHVAEAQLGGVAGRTAAARTAASEQLTKASAIAASLRAGPLLARTLDLARRARIDLGVDSAGGVPARSAPDALATLTSREMDVLDLLAAGRTNGEIGKALFISTKTASVHVSHILAKLGVSNRVEAAALAVGVHAARAATPP